MGVTSEMIIRMKEEDYFKIPSKIREQHLSSKIVSPELNDWNELMLDETYAKLYKQKKSISKDLEQRAYDLREQKRNNNLNK